MAIKKGNVRLQVTVGEKTISELEELCQLCGGMTRSNVVAYAIFSTLIEERLKKVEEGKEEKAKEGTEG